ncbi:MAG: hypothetical protein AB1405_02840, partial [Bdellovibrionota bacterium]
MTTLRALFFCTVSSFVLLALPALSRAQEAKTLERTLDAIVVTGEAAKPLWGKKIDNLRVFANRSGNWEVVPFQIDKKNPDGEFLIAESTVDPQVSKETGFESIPEAKKREKRIKKFEKKRDDYEEDVKEGRMKASDLEDRRQKAYWSEREGEIDYNDEIVFMAKDTGDRVPRALWKAPEGAELEITDPVDHSRSWAYLFYFPENPPALSTTDYVVYKPKEDQIIASMGEVDFDDERPMIVKSIVGIMPNGTRIPNILDRFKLRIRVQPYGLFCAPLFFDEQNAKGVTLGYKDGPVRVLRRNMFWVVIAGIRLPFAPKIIMYFKFYENGLATDAEFSNPIAAKYMVCPGSRFTAGLDLRNNARGAKIFTKDNKGIVIDGKMSPEEKNLKVDNQTWIAGFLPNKAALMSRMIYDERLVQSGAVLDLHLDDDDEKEDDPEDEKGQHLIGYTMDVRKFPSGTYRVGFQVYVAYDFEPGQEQQLFNIDDNPLKIVA